MSNLVKILMCMIVVVLSLCNYRVKGASGRSSISYYQIKEELEMERQLRILNKPPIKTIQTKEGQIFDCIDIYKQPAFENPLLKNHKIQMGPSSSPPAKLSNEKKFKSLKMKKRLENVLKRLDCPQGTVPIRRTTKEELTRFMDFSKSLDSVTNAFYPSTTYNPGVHLAYWRSKDSATNIKHGVEGEIGVSNPFVANDQYSGAQIWIEAGPFEELNTIQAGWAVAPSLYGDNHTRITTYWRGHDKIGCYNILCPGFIQVDKDYALGDVIWRTSEYGTRQQFFVDIYIYQDTASGDWWLKGGSQKRNIGYWPKQLFSHLANGATRIAWGGIVKGTPNGPSPQMGNGYFPDHSYYKATSVNNLKVMNEHYEFEYPEGDLEAYVDKLECYNLEYDGYVGEQRGFAFLFGGPGGNNCGN